ncbi:DUF1302 domain-containing protein [Cognatazoarcus halotolerans]|uniref:DUF1302 domain-containing protein n=1 Tax=Cognatazoarcus halotolerans TaxID=2686016 RepID=UPI00135B4613|nr:DUF1302 domain-containing protein [Cognatazoarcus halotolerans]MBX3679200.1 DUF1302 domain-containing protein [Rhodocyclaceae bacterium]MCB1901947.1 DUF1302 domain-containing protein [Rhodocyclaceae bacterium]MCP5310047.1 DUF1302 domain-containing protein [Zoogloeaceae bacterium]
MTTHASVRRARTPQKSLLALTLGVALASLATPSQAVRFGSGDGINGSIDSTLSFGFSTRMSGRDCEIISNDSGGCNRGTNNELQRKQGANGYANADFNYTNFDNGDLNYNKGDVFSAAVKGTHELSVRAPGGLSALARVTWFHDFQADQTRRTDVHESATDDATLLDAWVAKEFYIGDRRAKVKLGNQVISWGEDIFLIGGTNQINAFDLQKFHVPGTQLKEIFVPAPMISLASGVTDNLGVEAYYQFRWNGFKFDPVGTFFSGADVIGKGRGAAYLPTSVCNDFGLPLPCGDHSGLSDAAMMASGTAIPFVGEKKPKNGGQYGINLRYFAEELDTEFSFSYQRYHDKLPFLGFTGNNTGAVTGYYVAYGEDKDLYAVSLNTKAGPVAVGAELSYRPRDSVGVDPTVPFGSLFGGAFDKNSVYDVGSHPGYVEEEKWQMHLTGFYTFSHNDTLGGLAKALGSSDGFILTELAVAHYPNLDTSGHVPYFLPNYALPDRTSWGYVFEMGLNYPNAFDSGITMTPQIDWYHDVSGTSPNAIPFVQGRKSLALSVLFNYRDRWKGAVQYVNFWGGGDNNLMSDRDFLGASISYSF